ncbi:3-keto-5-aminohexanoate cleavage protein [Xenorhabdus sp. PB61.4]|uniref:3-keto-5-aminohexanoate cleavage protein n=1 Tax=Xenorhabdus sp. PB61.4 TaxID=2788940 RepID=UPI001E42D23D|nr:3-keto-5-aminohexanoate cleavage protein [Xenorhabdus sp. PB61.4]MCC8367507.1 3-keto-5-aminohexanoate cleavage protein [Xenorhabdus sp. PB61.4]
MKSLKLSVAMNGSKWGKKPNILNSQALPDFPCSVEEALRDTKACYALGVRQFHVHSIGSNGEHVADRLWYRNYMSSFRQYFHDASICLATSRSGQVTDQIIQKEKKLRIAGYSDEYRLLAFAETARLACLESDASLLPDFVTGFTATEVRMYDDSTDIGHVTSAQSPAVTHLFYDQLTQKLKELKVKQEIEITTSDSIDIIEKIQNEQLLRTPIRIIILPEFTSSLSGWSWNEMETLVNKAERIIKKTGYYGDIVMGAILRPNTPNLEILRRHWLKFAVENPKISTVRIGIEDCPVLFDKPTSNESLVKVTCELLNEFGGEILPLA